MVGAMVGGAEVRETELSDDLVSEDGGSALSAMPRSKQLWRQLRCGKREIKR